MRIKKYWLTCLMLLSATAIWAQKEDKEEISKTIDAQGLNALLIDNIIGGVKVEGYDGSTIQLEVTKTISADNPKDLAKGKEELQLKTGVEGEYIVVYIESPYIKRQHKNDNDKWWSYDWNGRQPERPYKYHLDMVLKVPRGMELQARTVNEGSISVSNMNGKYLQATNVNGDINLERVSGKTTAITVNGDITVTYAQNPTSESEYRTINGDINVSYQPSLEANLKFKSMHGEFLTDFEVEPITNEAKMVKSNNGRKVSFKLTDDIAVKVGNGGPLLKFETLNGNVFVKKSK